MFLIQEGVENTPCPANAAETRKRSSGIGHLIRRSTRGSMEILGKNLEKAKRVDNVFLNSNETKIVCKRISRTHHLLCFILSYTHDHQVVSSYSFLSITSVRFSREENYTF